MTTAELGEKLKKAFAKRAGLFEQTDKLFIELNDRFIQFDELKNRVADVEEIIEHLQTELLSRLEEEKNNG